MGSPQFVISNIFPQQHVTFHNLSFHFFSNMSLSTICHFQHFSTATCHFSQFVLSLFQQHVTFHNLSFPTFFHSNMSLFTIWHFQHFSTATCHFSTTCHFSQFVISNIFPQQLVSYSIFKKKICHFVAIVSI